MTKTPMDGPNRHTENRHTTPDKICNHFFSFGLTCNEYDQLKARADGRCEICQTPEEKTTRGKLVIDHFSGAGVWFVRGLVCDRCNSVMARHDRSMAWGPASLPFAEQAAEYHRNAWGQPTAEQFRLAAEDIAARRPWAGLTAALRDHARNPPQVQTREFLAQLPMHLPLRKLDRDARTRDLLTRKERRPSWYLNIWYLVYRFYGADLEPIYIGMTSTNATRWDAHRRRSEWWPLAEYVAVSIYPTYDDVKEAERAALRHEQPRFNKVLARGPANVKLPLHGTAKEAAALLFQEAMPGFIAELAAVLAQPDLFPQPVPPPPARFAESDDGEP